MKILIPQEMLLCAMRCSCVCILLNVPTDASTPAALVHLSLRGIAAGSVSLYSRPSCLTHEKPHARSERCSGEAIEGPGGFDEADRVVGEVLAGDHAV